MIFLELLRNTGVNHFPSDAIRVYRGESIPYRVSWRSLNDPKTLPHSKLALEFSLNYGSFNGVNCWRPINSLLEYLVKRFLVKSSRIVAMIYPHNQT